jgi:hypothetical protein
VWNVWRPVRARQRQGGRYMVDIFKRVVLQTTSLAVYGIRLCASQGRRLALSTLCTAVRSLILLIGRMSIPLHGPVSELDSLRSPKSRTLIILRGA